jgi:hypothetical protein
MVAELYAGDHICAERAFVKTAFLGLVSAACVLAAGAAAAHHSFAAEFDIGKPVKLSGPVTKMEWTNPHAWIFIDAKNDKGEVQNWAIELVGINDLVRRGWGRNRVKAGDVIAVDGYAAKNGKNIANAASVKIAKTGELLWASVAREGQKE